MRNYRTKARPKSSRGNFKSCNFWCDIEGLRWPHPASLAACSTLLFLGEVLLHMFSSPCQIFCGCGFSSSLRSPIQPRFHFLHFTLGPLRALDLSETSCRFYLLHKALTQHPSSNMEEGSQLLYLQVACDSKPEPSGWHCQVWPHAWDKSWPSWIIFSVAFISSCF